MLCGVDGAALPFLDSCVLSSKNWNIVGTACGQCYVLAVQKPSLSAVFLCMAFLGKCPRWQPEVLLLLLIHDRL